MNILGTEEKKLLKSDKIHVHIVIHKLKKTKEIICRCTIRIFNMFHKLFDYHSKYYQIVYKYHLLITTLCFRFYGGSEVVGPINLA